MSLINEALKKAERMRREQGGEPAGDGQPSAPRPAKKGSSAMLVGGIAVGATVLVCASVIVTLRLARKPVDSIAVPATQRAIDAGGAPTVVSAKPVPAQPAVLLDAKPEVPPQTPTSPTITIPSTVEQKPAVKQTAVPAPAPRPAPPADSTASGAPTPTQAPLISLAAVEHAGAAPAAQPPSTEHIPGSPSVQAFVNNLKIMGIRASGNESRVLMNDRVYRVNDVVDRSLGLRLVEVSDDRLVFEDANGARYFRNF